MKLLTPTAANDIRGQELARDLIRAKETAEVVKKTNSDLAKAEADFASMVARHRKDWANEDLEHANWKREAEQEVAVLEERKKQALIPVEAYKQESEKKMAEALSLIEAAKQRESDAEDLLERLENKLDEVGDRELAAKKDEDRIALMKKGIEAQQQSVIDGSNRLSQEMKNLLEMRQKAEADIEDRKKGLFLIERSLLAKGESLKRTEAGLSEWGERLKDKETTLERGFKELQGKGISA